MELDAAARRALEIQCEDQRAAYHETRVKLDEIRLAESKARYALEQARATAYETLYNGLWMAKMADLALVIFGIFLFLATGLFLAMIIVMVCGLSDMAVRLLVAFLVCVGICLLCVTAWGLLSSAAERRAKMLVGDA